LLSDLSAGPSEKLADRWLGSLTDPIVPQSNMNIKCNQQAIADRLSPFSLSQASGVVLCSGVVQWCCAVVLWSDGVQNLFWACGDVHTLASTGEKLLHGDATAM
jgi:hypothetical protein